MKIENLVGKIVQIYPGDHYSKSGEILEINEQGVLFRITKSNEPFSYKVGEIRFISYAARLVFSIQPGQ